MTTTSVGSTGPVELDHLQIDFTDNANNDQQALDINVNENRLTTGPEVDNQPNSVVVTGQCPDNHNTVNETRGGIQFETGDNTDNIMPQNGANVDDDTDEGVLSYDDEPEEVRMIIDGLVEESIAAGLAIYVDELNRKNNPDNPVKNQDDGFEGFDQVRWLEN